MFNFNYFIQNKRDIYINIKLIDLFIGRCYNIY